MSLKPIVLSILTSIGFSSFTNPVHASSIIIDDFNLSQDVGFRGILPIIPENSQAGPGNVLGGFRDMQVMGDADSFIETRLTASNGQLSFANNVETTGSGTIIWDGDDNPTILDTTGLGGIDITGLDLNSILVAITSADLPGLEISFTIWDLNGNTSSLSREFNSAILNPKVETFLFTDFIGSADFTNVGAIKFQLDGPAEIDVTLSSIEISATNQVVPEPLTILGAGTGVAFGANFKRKLNKAKKK